MSVFSCATALLLLLSLQLESCHAQQTIKWSGNDPLAPVTLPVGGTVTLTWTAGKKEKQKGVAKVSKHDRLLVKMTWREGMIMQYLSLSVQLKTEDKPTSSNWLKTHAYGKREAFGIVCGHRLMK